MEILNNKVFFNGLDRVVYWSKLFAVLMIISGSLMVLVAIFGGSIFSSIPDEFGYGASMGALTFFIYGILAAIYLIPEYGF